MTKPFDQRPSSRRALLRRLAEATAFGLTVSKAFAQDATLQALIEQNQSNDFGQGFDAGSRTIQMPEGVAADAVARESSRPRRRWGQFEAIVAKGGWPEVAQADRLRLGSRNPAVIALRRRLTAPATSPMSA